MNNDPAPYYLLSKIQRQANAWHIPTDMLIQWLNDHNGSSFETMTETQANELFNDLGRLADINDALPAKVADKADYMNLCESLGVSYENTAGVVTNLELRLMIRRAESKAAQLRLLEFDPEQSYLNMERAYHEKYQKVSLT